MQERAGLCKTCTQDSDCPQAADNGDGQGSGDAAERLARTLKELEDAGLEAIGQVVHPDPYTAIHNALDFYGIDEVVISTFSAMQSGWPRSDLIGRVRNSTSKPVHHVVSDDAPNPQEAGA